MSAETKLTARSALGVLRNAAYRRYIIGSSISDTGTWMQVMAQGYVMSTLTDKAVWLGMANFAAGLPMLALTMVGGSAADKHDKRKILLITQYVQIALAISIGYLVWSGQIVIWHVLAFAAILGISNSFEMPALSALVPELVKRDQIQSAIAIDRSVFHGSRVVGPTMGGILISAWGTASAFFANAVTFVALIIALLSLPPRTKGSAEEEEKRTTGIKDGFRFVGGDKPSLAMVILIATQSVCIFPIITVMMPLYVRLVLGLGPDRLGFLMGASAIGSVVGSIFLIGLAREKRVPLMILCAIGVSGAIFGLGMGPSFYVATGLLIINSLGLATNFGLASTIVQERAPDYLRGRVSAVFMLSFVGLMPIAGLGVTSLSDFIGMPKALVIAAIVYGIITICVLLRVRKECAEPGTVETHLTTPSPTAAVTISANP
ncbi:MAG TPA: MFS transporter [Chthoniobacterales bacterium]|jgi:MFS family permease|nr:MFS transporter [Chthoniobacterales bacterium]